MFPKPIDGSVFYEDDILYACLAFHPIVDGHTIVVIKKEFSDLNNLPEDIYLHLMKCIFKIRKTMLDIYKTDKVYVCYLDETKHVHFHLFPRTGKLNGFEMMHGQHGTLTDFSKIILLSNSLS